MHTKQTIALIGATGRLGSALARNLAKGHYRLLLKGSRSEALEALVESIIAATPGADVEAQACPTDACWEADIIVLAVPGAAEAEVAGRIREVANQKVVVSLSRPVHPEEEEAPESAGVLQACLPHSKVVQAYPATPEASCLEALTHGTGAEVFLAGNDREALETVSELVQAAGLQPVIAGSRTAGRTL
ncbi:MAG TPA: NAD(P)-binding domain-containing protein [Chitinophagaceae bacterium]|nr:NAD(P)-binding domain-containing protein [Chitinophagaceae bacterium]